MIKPNIKKVLPLLQWAFKKVTHANFFLIAFFDDNKLTHKQRKSKKIISDKLDRISSDLAVVLQELEIFIKFYGKN